MPQKPHTHGYDADYNALENAKTPEIFSGPVCAVCGDPIEGEPVRYAGNAFHPVCFNKEYGEPRGGR